MPAKLKIIRAREFLQITSDDNLDLRASKKLLIDIATSKIPPADYDLLLDLRRAQWRLTVSDMYRLASELHNHNNTFKNKVAILVLPGDTFDSAEFLEVCSKNQGFNLEAFSNFEDAIYWLSDETTNKASSLATS